MMVYAQPSSGATLAATQNVLLRITTLSGTTSEGVREGSHEVETIPEATAQHHQVATRRCDADSRRVPEYRSEDQGNAMHNGDDAGAPRDGGRRWVDQPFEAAMESAAASPRCEFWQREVFFSHARSMHAAMRLQEG